MAESENCGFVFLSCITESYFLFYCILLRSNFITSFVHNGALTHSFSKSRKIRVMKGIRWVDQLINSERHLVAGDLDKSHNNINLRNNMASQEIKKKD